MTRKLKKLSRTGPRTGTKLRKTTPIPEDTSDLGKWGITLSLLGQESVVLQRTSIANMKTWVMMFLRQEKHFFDENTGAKPTAQGAQNKLFAYINGVEANELVKYWTDEGERFIKSVALSLPPGFKKEIQLWQSAEVAVRAYGQQETFPMPDYWKLWNSIQRLAMYMDAHNARKLTPRAFHIVKKKKKKKPGGWFSDANMIVGLAFVWWWTSRRR